MDMGVIMQESKYVYKVNVDELKHYIRMIHKYQGTIHIFKLWYWKYKCKKWFNEHKEEKWEEIHRGRWTYHGSSK